MEEEGNMSVQILGTQHSFPEYLLLNCADETGREVVLPVL